jgi:hypothetical protein
VHAEIKEEIFYPKAREALKRSGQSLLDEAEVKDEGIKWKVAELKTANPTEDHYDAKVTVLTDGGSLPLWLLMRDGTVAKSSRTLHPAMACRLTQRLLHQSS